MQKKLIKELLGAGYALFITYEIGKLLIHAAYIERGYEAVGGEYLAIPLVYLAAWKLFEVFINALEEEINGSKETGSRRNIRIRNHGRRFRRRAGMRKEKAGVHLSKRT